MSFSPFDLFLTECRVAGRIGRETLMGLKRSGWMNLVITITMASILSILGVSILILMDLSYFVKQVGSEVEISAYVKDEYRAEAVSDEMVALPHVSKITIITKEDAWEELKNHYQIPLEKEDNPLPDTIRIYVDDVKNIPQVVEKVSEFKEIEHVQYAKRIMEKITNIARGVTTAGFILGTFLFALSMFVIGNTIHLLIENKSREIEILRMMGIGNWYIRLPFIFQGASYGFIGALISFLPLWVANHFIVEFIQDFQFSVESYSVTLVSLILLLVGVAVGSSGSIFAVRKYLRI
jgi:cell division transport system permease protein